MPAIKLVNTEREYSKNQVTIEVAKWECMKVLNGRVKGTELLIDPFDNRTEKRNENTLDCKKKSAKQIQA